MLSFETADEDFFEGSEAGEETIADDDVEDDVNIEGLELKFSK